MTNTNDVSRYATVAVVITQTFVEISYRDITRRPYRGGTEVGLLEVIASITSEPCCHYYKMANCIKVEIHTDNLEISAGNMLCRRHLPLKLKKRAIKIDSFTV